MNTLFFSFLSQSPDVEGASSEYFGKALHHTRVQLKPSRSCVGAAGDGGLACVCSLISFYLLGFGGAVDTTCWDKTLRERHFTVSCG